MLFNSLKLFNCKITQWHYFLIFYFNERDSVTNNVGAKQLIASLNNDIQHLLYNPLTKNFYFKTQIINMKHLEISS